jgi:threonine dehydratase
VAGDLVTRDDVVRAAETIRGRVRRTPLLDASAIAPGLALKAELLQHTGSFKVRGVVNRLAALHPSEREHGVAGASAGNHAIALAWGAAAEGLDCVVFSWRAASPFKLNRARALGATVDVEADDPAGAFVRLEEHLAKTGSVLVHPFDDPVVMAGQGTVGLEILEDRPEVDVVVVPVGGAGLIAGIAAAVAPRGVRVVGVEPEGSASLDLALEAGKPVAIVPQTTAGGLDAPYAGKNALAVCQAAGVTVVRVPDEAIAEGMRRVYADAKLACEPAGLPASRPSWAASWKVSAPSSSSREAT